MDHLPPLALRTRGGGRRRQRRDLPPSPHALPAVDDAAGEGLW